jgi:hypothetical protein
MAPNRYYSSNAVETTLTAGISNSATSISVASATGYPASVPFTIHVDLGTSNEEIMTVTNVSSLNFTVTRGVDSSSALSHALGATVVHGVSAQDFQEPQDHLGASTNVHGITGAVAGVTAIQTLTNKTLTAPTIGDFTSSHHTHGNSAGGGFISMPRCRVKRTGSTFSLNASTDQAVTFTGTDILIGGTWWSSGTTITAPAGATGQAVGIVRALFQASGTNVGIRKAQLIRTADSALVVEATVGAPGASSTAWVTVSGSDTFNITAGDQFTLHIYHEAATALTINDCGASIYLIGA